jgi:DNA-binding transcriptional MerR regulator
MRIGELSRRSGVSERSLRYYEQQGLLDADRGSNGYREYDDAAVQRASTIQMLFGMDFPKDVVRSVLACSGHAADAAHASHDGLAEQLVAVRERLAERIERLTAAHEQVTAFLDAETGRPTARGDVRATTALRGR